MQLSNDTKFCPFCGEMIWIDAVKCRYCKEILSDDVRAVKDQPAYDSPIAPQNERKWSRGLAAILSLLIPGVGQIYKRHVGSGILWLIFVPLMFAITWVAGLLVYIACIYDAAVSEAD